MPARTRSDHMHLGVFFKNTGHHLASWRHPRAQPDAGINLAHYVACAQLVERAGFDFLFFADTAGVRDVPFDSLSRTAQFTAYFEPLTLLAALSTATSRIGLVATATTSFNEPYHVARKFASLDHLSAGRAGWNVVTSGMAIEARNFNRDDHYEHDERYRMATEFVDVVTKLWDSWDDDAFVYDRQAGRFFDPDGVHVLDHVGKYYKVRGPLNVPRSPQGHPVIFQAGSSESGRELAAATAEGVFSGQLSAAASAAQYADIKGRMARYGRDPEQLKLLPGCTVYCGETMAEAREKEEYLASLIDPVVGRDYIAGILGADLSACDPDGPVPELPPNDQMPSGRGKVLELARREGLSIRDLYLRLAGSHGKFSLRGTPSSIADEMEVWFEARACDGFIMQPTYMPGDLDDIVGLLVPELQDRGLIRVGYEGTTLRDHLGLARPPSRYERAGSAAASR